MTFLSKLGKVLATITAVAIGVGPVIYPLLGSKAGEIGGIAVNDLTSIGATVVQVETVLGATTGPEKLAKATPLVAQILLTSQLVSGKKIANNDLFVQGAAKITSGVADILNSIHESEVQTKGDALKV